jgi:DNA invertase Pin-like site-specific DNA recombinase
LSGGERGRHRRSAAAQGRLGGRPVAVAVDADTLAVALDRLRRGESVTKIADHLGVGRSTLYRSLAPHLEEARRSTPAAGRVADGLAT